MTSFSSLTLRLGTLAALLGLTHASHAQTITTIDVPNAIDTFPQAINAFGKIAGSYVDASRSLHGFVRTPFGALTTFDAPSVGDFSNTGGTEVLALNFAGQVVGAVHGSSTTSALFARGFVREALGAITEFDAAADALLTRAEAINPEGWVAGSYSTGSFISHGFVRSPNGAITIFDVPGLAGAIGPIREIGPRGEVIGVYQQSNGVFHGFVRELDGTFTSFDAPDVSPTTGGVFCSHCGGTFTSAANLVGRSVGFYGDAAHTIHGFLRKRNGTFSILDVPGAVQTQPTAINFESDVAGIYFDAVPATHGFLLSRHGTFESFDVAGSFDLKVTGLGLEGQVIGHYQGAGGIVHGFIRTPRAGCGHFHP